MILRTLTVGCCRGDSPVERGEFRESRIDSVLTITLSQASVEKHWKVQRIELEAKTGGVIDMSVVIHKDVNELYLHRWSC